jgi:predicted AAA+ superfamily ATPase
LSQSELEHKETNVVDNLFNTNALIAAKSQRDQLSVEQHIIRGGYPDSIHRSDRDSRLLWFEAYVSALIRRHVRDYAAIERLSDLPRLLRYIAARTATLLNYSDISRWIGLPNSTLKRYLALLETMFLVRRNPPWSANISIRFVRWSKIHVTDTGLSCALL